MRVTVLVVSLGLLAGSPAWAAAQEGDAQKGKTHFMICQSCHGEKAQGTPAQGAPRLAGQHPEYLRRQLFNFRAGLRGTHENDQYGQLMSNFAKGLPDEQAVRDVVAYIETLQP